MRIPKRVFPRYRVDVTDETLELAEPGLRIVNCDGEHVVSVLDDAEGFFDLNVALILAALDRQDRGERIITL